MEQVSKLAALRKTPLALFVITSILLLGNGCATRMPIVTPEARELFAKGQAILDCRSACGFSWQQVRHHLSILYFQEQWQPLADEVMRVGYLEDLSYYYLGRAAEGLGYYEAALKYYRTSGGSSKGGLYVCQTRSLNQCDGIVLPDVLYPRMAAVQTTINMKNTQTYQNHPIDVSPSIPAYDTQKKSNLKNVQKAAHKSKPKIVPEQKTEAKVDSKTGNDEWVTPQPASR